MRHCLWAAAACWFSAGALSAQTSSQPVRTLAEALAQRAATVTSQRVAPVVAEAVPATTVQDELRTLTEEAAVIFEGEVVSIERKEGSVDVRWRIEEAVRGVAGAEYVQREWSGLWTNGDRYTVGQRSLVMLHAPSVAGFSSPVRGMDGVMPLKGDAVSGTVDLRWILTHVQRADVSASGGVTAVRTIGSLLRAAPVSSAVAGRSIGAQSAVVPQDAAGTEATTADGVAERETVMSLMRAWAAVQQ